MDYKRLLGKYIKYSKFSHYIEDLEEHGGYEGVPFDGWFTPAEIDALYEMEDEDEGPYDE